MTVIHNLSRDAADVAYAGCKANLHVNAHLTDLDRRALEAHLQRCLRSEKSARLLAGILRQKIAWTHSVEGEVPRDMAIAGRRVSYMVTGGGLQSGLLTHLDTPPPELGDAIPVRSLLGATLIGMRVGQRAPLLREDGTILTLALLEVTDPL